jgi:uncharacterized membrane protein (Fun14 family)
MLSTRWKHVLKLTLAFILNLFVPGLGSLIIGYRVQGPIQIVLTLFAFVLLATVWLAFFGVVLFVLVWLHALILWMLRLRRKSSTD